MKQTTEVEQSERSIAVKARSFRDQLVGAAGYVENLRPGPRAILRRLRDDRDAIPPEVFWSVVERYGILPEHEPFWLIVLPLMVEHPHQPGLTPGVAIARSEVSSARVEKWLRLDVEAARKDAGRFVARVESGFDWTQFGQLLRFWSRDDRRSFARQYFLSPEYRARTATSAGAE